ncbi:hypothetical protein EDD76_103296 [Kineothrix alysoides]|uniref:Uncharacterized protein n=1 Tax=Kineothrix alysoides TaxID=1469948 RepID=A0A4R1R3U1_9FIRM|nr:hypothetical protein [Kineothrix alysoides]TCL60103.1 hypothetical protein EDD76_103296 [Kineothrix alysoides]
MKIVKKIIYALLALVLTGAVVLVGIILFAEYSGRRFTPGSTHVAEGIEDDKSRLVYDENGNVVELPSESSDSLATTGQETAAPAQDIPSGDASAPSEDASVTVQEVAAGAETTSEEDNIERVYVMDMGANLFHTADCPYVQEIKPEDLSEMTTSRAKILNAGYQPCTSCNP